MIPLKGSLHWRKTAPFHVQLELQNGARQFERDGQYELSGRVVRVFRTDGRLSLGDNVEFAIWVCRPENAPPGPPAVYREKITKATHIEIYLYGSPPKCAIAGYEFEILNAPTHEPVMTVAQLEEELRSMGDSRLPSFVSAALRWLKFWR